MHRPRPADRRPPTAPLVLARGISAASGEPLLAAGRVAAIPAFASLAAPPWRGIAAESRGTRRALVLITVAMIVSVSLARHTGRPPVAVLVAGQVLANPTRWGDLSESTGPTPSGEPDAWGRPVAETSVPAVPASTVGVR